MKPLLRVHRIRSKMATCCSSTQGLSTPSSALVAEQPQHYRAYAVEKAILEAQRLGKKFRVVVVDSSPKFEGARLHYMWPPSHQHLYLLCCSFCVRRQEYIAEFGREWFEVLVCDAERCVLRDEGGMSFSWLAVSE